MMPTFPRSPRSFRTAGFPQYGWKAGLSGGAFPNHQRLKPTPGMHLLTPGLPSPFVHLRVGAVAPYCAGPPTGRCTAMEGGLPLARGEAQSHFGPKMGQVGRCWAIRAVSSNTA